MSFLLNPFVFAGAAGDFESIATVTVGSGGASSITFSSIPGTYQHLQVRLIARSDDAGSGNADLQIEFNGASTTYAWHSLRGNGTNAAATGATGASVITLGMAPRDGSTATVWGASVVDILDYADTSKNTTVRALGGNDLNGSGVVSLNSVLWANLSAVSSIDLTLQIGDFKQYSHAALYGIKA